jgi:hypothetical protein
MYLPPIWISGWFANLPQAGAEFIDSLYQVDW